ncbi:conserved Plasmodium protein, unknown function [Plasmodium berghei]|uniref:Uncharacterized protein n=2 Tax=Plasmodium berghei TaxID=5821 RepID=A0A509ASY8_PLABA|nr:conserved Plasmodium protein, unknown function [Plasmodium berghei ANKA]CXJ02959.1 conserved Plasmodium protein, unknown function [Plasmodium berghei]SCL98387.1 conserved Plasmodium protein, unknown function [Plasmodium berghei]SCM16821.1 conserved Plasmodium protein, unknown function [Plasmodium berghei]SCM18619.1 conserved Plasmodium protein, unknown function [Plasmodium berghei]SCN28054.1 conserved Plasmodium protein, unknown function [Plasmodium berghei]|eukprot:XP_034423705.1 conserved Plasmodium protein, unknown function [Plasmodium berghei ANKA]
MEMQSCGNKINNKDVKELNYTNKNSKRNKINETELGYNKECNYKMFFFIVQLQQKLKDLEKENERLKILLKRYNKETIDHDNKMIKKVLFVLSCIIFVIIFFLF